jgi:hypothetical protein
MACRQNTTAAPATARTSTTLSEMPSIVPERRSRSIEIELVGRSSLRSAASMEVKRSAKIGGNLSTEESDAHLRDQAAASWCELCGLTGQSWRPGRALRSLSRPQLDGSIVRRAKMSMPLRSEAIHRWWPTTQSLDLVEGTVESVASAVDAEVRRFLKGEDVTSSWQTYPDLDSAFQQAPEFANVPTFYLVLPSRSRWTVLWNNSFLCDGYDSLCWCLTKNHGLTTIHWSAHDELTTFQTGAAFCHRRRDSTGMTERSVYVAREDKRWDFHASGPPLPEEDVRAYAARHKRDRLNEAQVMQLLRRLGASPWSEDFYALPESGCFQLQRPDAPGTVLRRSAAQVLATGR